jgi:lipocalin
MMRRKVSLKTLLCVVLVASMAAVSLPAAAQEADWLVSSERGTVGISSPAADDTVSGAVEITGTATSPDFSYYKVEYSVDGDTWFPVDGDAYMHETAVTEDVLVTWDTTVFKDGTYWLRAVVVDNTGNYVASDPLSVTVAAPEVEEEVVAEAEEEVAAEEEMVAEEAVAEEEVAAEEEAAAPSWLVSSERGTVGISSPAADDMVSGAAVITGTATSPDFYYYKVEYSVDGDTWFPVDGDAYMHETAVTEDTLVTWDTTVFKDGTYWLRAVVVDNTGNYVASGAIMVTVSNPEAED